MPQGVRRAPWAAVAVATEPERLGAVAAELAARMRADVGSVGVIVPAAARAAVEATVGATTRRDPVERRQRARAGRDQGARVRRGGGDRAGQAILDERPDGGRGGLYTALTRSTRALAVLHAEPLPGDLAAASDLHVVRDVSPAQAWASHRRG